MSSKIRGLGLLVVVFGGIRFSAGADEPDETPFAFRDVASDAG